ncbi:hypothetical protein OIU78_007843 [Salix suchowensis]|nr:hypothetical protein OIU78_007843 [Salix suchowensis]
MEVMMRSPVLRKEREGHDGLLPRLGLLLVVTCKLPREMRESCYGRKKREKTVVAWLLLAVGEEVLLPPSWGRRVGSAGVEEDEVVILPKVESLQLISHRSRHPHP